MDIMRQSVIFSRRKLRFQKPLSREFSLGILLIILVLVTPTFVSAVRSAGTPVTIAAASLPTAQFVPDWLDALSWMNSNLPSTSVVFAWWDYGYWISVNTGRHTLADNGTGNLTQIQAIATGFMLNESLAVKLMQRYGVTHVAIFVSYNRSPVACGPAGQVLFCGFGEDSKWFWMVRIANGTRFETPMGMATVNFREVIDPSTGATTEYRRTITIAGSPPNDVAITTSVGGAQLPASNTVLGHLMRNSYPNGLPGDPRDIEEHTTGFFKSAFTSTNFYVLVYSVTYPEQTTLSVKLNPAVITGSANTTITGTLTTASGTPIQTTVPIAVEYTLDPNSNTWTLIGISNSTSAAGTFTLSPDWSPPSGSPIFVRARWGGDLSRLLDIGVSAAVPLTRL